MQYFSGVMLMNFLLTVIRWQAIIDDNGLWNAILYYTRYFQYMYLKPANHAF